MKELAHYGFILALICVIAAGLLAGVNALTKDKIAAQARFEEEAALKEIMPQAAKFVEKNPTPEISFYQAFDNQDKKIGFVFKASGKGYSSEIQTLVGMFLDGRISAIKVLSLNETPGLGMRVKEDGFTRQFNNQEAMSLANVQAITGATISSRAVMDSIIKKAQELKEYMQNEK